MNKATRYFRLAGASLLLMLAGAAAADETEIFTGASNSLTAQLPNILFIIDSSGSMSTNVVTQIPFNIATTYPGSCIASRVYFVSGSNKPSCASSASIPAVAFKCNAASAALAATGQYSPGSASAQWRSVSGTFRWRNITITSSNTAWVECRADAGVHGNGVNPLNRWASDALLLGGWAPLAAQQITWTANGSNTIYTFYSANYLNWLLNASNNSIVQTRLQIVQDAAKETIDQLAAADNTNVGLMRYSINTTAGCSDTRSAEGGMVLQEIGPIGTNAAAMKNLISSITANGCTPLSETMYEAYRYLSGGGVTYGLNSRISTAASGAKPSVLSSRESVPNTGVYKSPLATSCQKNFIVLLTDGLPTADNSADTAIQGLIGANCAGSGDGKCLEEIAKYMYERDMRPSLAGLQNVTTYTIGFNLTGADAAGKAVLQNTASGAGGVFYEANDSASLSTVLTQIVRTILDYNTSFTAPAVSVNAFNRTQNLNDLYVTVFKPSETYAWAGNVKKYRLDPNGTILDATGSPAVDVATGFFRTTAQSYWTTGVDGENVRLGGAANEQPVPTSRRIYSDLNNLAVLTATSNQVTVANASITTATLGLGAAEAPGRDLLIGWLRGADIDDENANGLTTDARNEMGDPMHGRPATVIYGGTVTSPDPTDGVIYAVTNDGYLHAINAVNGSELWAFIPRQMLARARDLHLNNAVTDRVFGLDGNIRVLKNEVNENGVLEPGLGERVYVYFGMRRGGSEYYGLDVTDRNAPTLLFKIGPNEAGLKQILNAGQSWSTPTVARVNVSGATQNTLQQVLVFGGGYDTVQDNGPYVTDTAGNQIFMVDAVSGNRLWYAGPNSDTSANLRHASMTHSIPGDVRIFDLTGDGYADRMYAADMGGRVWRFDISNGQPAASLVTGGVFASLGNAHLSTHPDATTRRFYNAPDISFLSSGGRTWLNLAIGSGYRGHPLNLATQDHFYSLRDHRPFARLTQAQYNSSTVITEADVNLIDVTTNIAPAIPPGASGWRMDLRRPSAAFSGEKSLSEARTVQSMIQFSTYEPNSASTASSNSCTPGVGTNRLYTVSAFTGAPVYDRENPTDPPDSTDDRDTELAQGGIAPEVVWLFPSPDNPQTCVGAACRPPPQCLVGLENCGVGINLAPVRTFWRQTGVN